MAENFASRLRAKIAALNLTQGQVARATFVSRQTVHRWLAGGTLPLARHLEEIALLLDVSPQWLITGDDSAKGCVAGRNLDTMGIHFLYAREIRRASRDTDPLAAAYQRLMSEGRQLAVFAENKLREIAVLWDHGTSEITSEAVKKYRFTNSDSSVIRHPMPLPANIDALLERVRIVTAKRGEKKALAEFLGVSQQQLSDWVTKTKRKSPNPKPGGDITLQMLVWVQAKEAPQNKKTSVPRERNRGEGPIQRNQANENQKIRPRKKASHKGTKRSTSRKPRSR
ncbi:MAG TPA: helix-turn-helix transcriptional regulator [Chthoniobacterales bacterium]